MSSTTHFGSSSASCMDCGPRAPRMFCNLSGEELRDFDRIGVQVKLPKGAILFQQDDPSEAVAVICSGQFKLACTSREGKRLIVRIARPGDVLGLGAALSESRYEVTAEAAEPSIVKSIQTADFLAFLERHGEASMHAARTLSEEYKSAFFDARRLALAPSAAGRVASVLLDWARSAGDAQGEGRFVMALTHEEFANLAGTSRETVTRVLGRFQRERLIHIHGTAVTVLNGAKLAELSE